MYSKAKGSKVSRYQELKQVEKTLGRKPKALQDLPQLDPDLDYLWAIFVELSNGSKDGITYTDIKAYCDLKGELSLFEVEAIMAISEERVRSNNVN